MDEKIVTIDTIINWLTQKVENKEPINPGIFIDAAQKIIILMSEETDKLFDLEQNLAKIKLKFIEAGDKVSTADVKIEATDEYKIVSKQKAKLKQIDDLIKISKLQGRIRLDEYRNN